MLAKGAQGIRWVRAFAIIAVIATIGSVWLTLSHADTPPTGQVEAESGIVDSRATIVSDATASNATAVTFGASVAPHAPWGNKPFYVNPNNAASVYAAANPAVTDVSYIARIGQQPVAQWFGSWNLNVQNDVNKHVTAAAAENKIPVLVAYNIPSRDCGGFSSGGAQTETDYNLWIQQFANGIGANPAVVILEPDAAALTTCLTAAQLAARNRELIQAVTVLKANVNTYVYIDAGHPGWNGVSNTASRLLAAGIALADGFSLNVSNFDTTANNIAYGDQISPLVGGKHFVVDTSRNGNGGTPDKQWCNPLGQALGTTSTTLTGDVLADALLWIKTPWASDGACNGNPPAGGANWGYVIDLAKSAGW